MWDFPLKINHNTVVLECVYYSDTELICVYNRSFATFLGGTLTGLLRTREICKLARNLS